MGIDQHGARFLFYAAINGVKFDCVATIGRQGLFLSVKQLRAIAKSFDRSVSSMDEEKIFDGTGYAEGLISYFGADEINSLDASPYEKANIVHDMNQPVPRCHHDRYSVVIDGGSLEHIFNFPQAIRNCMEMVSDGGHYIGITPANNFFGHGFYQFSPELYFNILSEGNGYEMKAMFAFEDIPDARWYRVRNPIEVGERVALCNSHPVFLLVLAQRTLVKAIFQASPQQSDYAAIWAAQASERPESTERPPRSHAVRLAKLMLPAFMRKALRSLMQRASGGPTMGFDARHFLPVDSNGVDET